MTDQWALLWSKRQNCLHIEPVEHWLSKNRIAYRDDNTLADYHPIYVGEKAVCESTADCVRCTLQARESEKPFPTINPDLISLTVREMGEPVNQGA